MHDIGTVGEAASGHVMPCFASDALTLTGKKYPVTIAALRATNANFIS